jgi:hypothetical protein
MNQIDPKQEKRNKCILLMFFFENKERVIYERGIAD